jgi:hypothetical protein
MRPADYKQAIQQSGNSIYTPVRVGDPTLWIPTPHLEELLNTGLRGLNLRGLPLRTRSKVVKTAVCQAMGYPVPNSFKKTQPRFFGQQLDTYAQKALNLQIWNEELAPNRRYALIRVSETDVVQKVKVVNGQALALLDTTGKITTKYQARLELGGARAELVSTCDTSEMLPYITRAVGAFRAGVTPTDDPEQNALLSIAEIYRRLAPLVGSSFPDPGVDQDRNRGAALHRLVCDALEYGDYGDSGQFPDVRHQLLEVKLQTAATIDLGLVLPTSEAPLDVRRLGTFQPRHRDTRYAVFCAKTDAKQVTLTHVIVSTGADFFTRFKRCEGKVQNGKIQIPLPASLFSN